jgi:hypothetical protein
MKKVASTLELAAVRPLASKTKPFEYRSVRYWSKEINGTRTGAQKNNFFKFAILTTPPWRARRWNPVDSWS